MTSTRNFESSLFTLNTLGWNEVIFYVEVAYSVTLWLKQDSARGWTGLTRGGHRVPNFRSPLSDICHSDLLTLLLSLKHPACYIKTSFFSCFQSSPSGIKSIIEGKFVPIWKIIVAVEVWACVFYYPYYLEVRGRLHTPATLSLCQDHCYQLYGRLVRTLSLSGRGGVY
jgi:hypothetical protein